MEVPFGDANLPTIYLDYIIPGDVTVNGQDIFWRPSAAAAEVLLNLSSQLEARARLITRLTLKGSNIWQLDSPDVYLDGEVTSIPDDPASPHNLKLPSGDGKRGGDFETWFNVITSEPEVTPTDDFFVAGVLHPATMIGVNTTRIVTGTVQVVNPDLINRRLDALDRGYDHEAAVRLAGLTTYTPSDTPFDPELAREMLASSELQTDGFIVLVVIQEEIQQLGLEIFKQWVVTFRELGLEFRSEIVPAADIVGKLPEFINVDFPVSLVIGGTQLLTTLDDDATLGQFFATEFSRRI
jgi:hypothetical protein